MREENSMTRIVQVVSGTFPVFVLMLVFLFAVGCAGHMAHESRMATGTEMAEEGAQTTCPVAGEKLKNRETFIDCQGQRIYLCCPGCKPSFLKNPEAAFEKFEKEGVVLENVQKTCPVCDAPVDPKSSQLINYKGRRIFFGCPGCDKKFLADPDKYLEKLGCSSEANTDEGGSGHHHGHGQE
jgi:YHS domain-containing protein